jgi:hypothetical protein
MVNTCPVRMRRRGRSHVADDVRRLQHYHQCVQLSNTSNITRNTTICDAATVKNG